MAIKDPIKVKDPIKMWQQIALQAAQEKNPDRLLQYVNELNAALDKQASSQPCKKPSEPQAKRKSA